MAAFLPPARRRRALRRIALKGGITRQGLQKRIELLDLDFSQDASKKAIADYERKIDTIYGTHALHNKIMRRLRRSLDARNELLHRIMSTPISMKKAAAFFGTTPWTVRAWCNWLGAMEPDIHGMLTPYQLVDFLRSDYKWLAPERLFWQIQKMK